MSYKVYRCPAIQIPAGIGIFRKRVFLPDAEYSDEELFYILVHEVNHFINGDLILKFLIQLCTCVFWWNPILCLIQKDMARILEVRCDASVTRHLHAEEASEYMNIIVKTLKWSSTQNRGSMHRETSVFLMDSGSARSETERFYILRQSYGIRRSNPVRLTGTILISALLIGSYLFLPIPNYEVPLSEIEVDGAVYIDPEKSWIILENGTYYLCINGGEWMPISDLTMDSLLNNGFTVKDK